MMTTRDAAFSDAVEMTRAPQTPRRTLENFRRRRVHMAARLENQSDAGNVDLPPRIGRRRFAGAQFALREAGGTKRDSTICHTSSTFSNFVKSRGLLPVM